MTVLCFLRIIVNDSEWGYFFLCDQDALTKVCIEEDLRIDRMVDKNLIDIYRAGGKHDMKLFEPDNFKSCRFWR